MVKGELIIDIFELSDLSIAELPLVREVKILGP